MTVPEQLYRPTGTSAVDMAVAVTVTSGVVTAVRITLRSRAVLATPATFVTDNSLEHEVVSRAGLDESTTFSAYTSVSSTTYGSDYVYVVDATVDTDG